jgi:hypothetical protein
VLDFLLTQSTSASAKQYSVQVIHTFISFRDFGLIDGTSFAKELSAAPTRSQARLAANLTDVLISIRRRTGGAEGKSTKSPINEVGFRGCQLASASANQYSVLIVHVFLLSLFLGPFIGPKLF